MLLEKSQSTKNLENMGDIPEERPELERAKTMKDVTQKKDA